MIDLYEWDRLKRRVAGLGAHGRLLRDLENMIPEEGAVVMRQIIAAGESGVAKLNESYRELVAVTST